MCKETPAEAPPKKRGHYNWFLGSILSCFVAYPLVMTLSPEAAYVMDIFLAVVMVSAAYAIVGRGRYFLLCLSLLLAGLFLALTSYFLAALWARIASELVFSLFCLLIFSSIVREVMWEKAVDFNLISGALCGFLLIGLMFNMIFHVLEMAWPGSLEQANGQPLISPHQGPGYQDWFAFFYFSFVTITTLGYGDIVPKSGPAGAMTVLEAIIGQFYLVVLVARLVSQYSSVVSRKKGKKTD